MIPNRFGIPEPRGRGRHLRPLRQLDLVLVPLVGFDASIHRIGMGGGYYDRTFAQLNRPSRWRRPRLIGLAHECQRVERIETRPWDVSLDAVITEHRIYSGKHRNRSLPTDPWPVCEGGPPPAASGARSDQADGAGPDPSPAKMR